MTKSTLNIGQELHSDNILYRIVSVLGQGSFGVTYKAKAFTVIKGKFGEELAETSTPKAIKEFFMKEVNERTESGSITGMSEGSLSYNYALKFKKEAENLAGINHPNIVKVIDFISANNTYYYVMDYIEGENLNEYLKHHKMTEEEATNTIKKVSKALKYMHEEKHMLHLDLKPGNIMRRENDGHIFLIDFGLSKHYNEDGIPETSTSVGLGTPGYAPIEQANSKNAKKFRATLDVYALGATFFKLLTGQTPPSADELVSDSDIIKEELDKHEISNNISNVVVKAMKPNVKERIQNIQDFTNSLDGKSNIEIQYVVALSDDENTVISEYKKQKTGIQKNTNPKKTAQKSTQTRVESTNKKEDAAKQIADSQKSPEDSSNSGCYKSVFGLIAFCLVLLWYNDLWFFSHKEVVDDTPTNGRLINSEMPVRDSTFKDFPNQQTIQSSPRDTKDEIVESNGYRKNGDGTITDTKRQLMWMSKDYVSIEGHPIPNASWHKAVEWCNKINSQKFAGYSDWRLPTVKELVTLARPASQRKFYKSFFEGSNTDYFWSGNSVSSAVKSYVSMNDGFATSGESEGHGLTYGGTKLTDFSVRLVRDVK